MLVADKPKASKKPKADTRALNRKAQSTAVVRHISNYFTDADGASAVDLHCDRYINMCLDFDTCDAVDLAYNLMKAQDRFQSSCGDGTMGEDMQLVIGLIRRMREKCIPQEFSAGILLMHLEIVEGIQF